jgi:hypothetical protein
MPEDIYRGIEYTRGDGGIIFFGRPRLRRRTVMLFRKKTARLDTRHSDRGMCTIVRKMNRTTSPIRMNNRRTERIMRTVRFQRSDNKGFGLRKRAIAGCYTIVN